MNKDKIIDKIVKTLYEDHFSPKESDFSVGLRDAVELFYQLITTPIKEKGLDELDITLLTPIGNFSESDIPDKRAYITTIATAFEVVIKKVFFLTDTTKYEKAVNGKKKWTFKELIENCGILRNNKDTIISRNPTPITDTSGFPEYLQKVYETRNILAHEKPSWEEPQLSIRYIACLMIYVCLVLENYNALKSGIENFIKAEEHKKLMAGIDMEKYLNSIIAKIENEPTFPRKRYTDLEGEENIDLIDDDFADREIEEDVSMYDDNEEDYTEDDEDEEDESFDDEDFDDDEDHYDFTPQREKRKGKISELRQTIRQMIIRGNPGMGKTTTLRYLTLCDAKQQQPVPFLFYLKGYQSNKGSILAQIAQSNKLETTWLEQYLNNGYGALYLDGLNEIIDPAEREKLKTEIEGLAAKDINMVVSSREKAYDTDRFKIPVFDLKPLNLQQITDYVRKAYGKKTIELQTEGVNAQYTPETFADLLQKNAKLYALCQNPFFLRMYVDVVRRIQQFPENTGLLLRTFIKGSTQNGTNIGGLLGREERKPDKAHWRENRNKYEMLTEYLAYHTRLQKNVAFSRRSALELMAIPNSQYFGNRVDLDTLINDLKDLHLLEENDQQLSFVHELYQEYFAAEALTHLHQQTPNLVATLATQSNWTEPLILFDGLLQNNVATFEQISATNSETAARALVASLAIQPQKRQINLKYAQTDAQNFADAQASARGFMALLYLGEHDLITKIVKTVEKPNKTHKQIMESIVQSCAAEQLIDFLWTLKDITGTAKPLLDWAVDGIEEELDLGNNAEKGDELIIYWLGNVIYSAIAVKIFAKLKKQNLALLEVVVEKAMRNNNFKVVVQLVEKYALQEKYPIEFLIEKSVATNNFELADQLVEKYALQERYPIEFLIKKAVATSNFETAVQLVEKYALEEKYPIEFLIEKAIEKYKVTVAIKLVEKYALQTKYSIEFLIKKAVATNDFETAVQLVEKYALEEKYPIEFLIEKAIETNKLTIAVRLVEKYALEEKYPIGFLIEKAIEKNKPTVAVQLVEKYALQEKYAEKLIGKVIEANNFTAVVQLVEKYALQEKYAEKLVEKVIKTNDFIFAAHLVEKYGLQEKHSIEFLIEKAIEINNLTVAIQLAEKYALQEKYAEKLIEKAIEKNNLTVAIQLAEKYALQEKSAEKLIEKAVATNNLSVVVQLVEKYALQEKYPIEFLIEKAMAINNFKVAVQLVEKYALQEKYAEKLIGKVIETNNLTFALQLMKKYALQEKYPIEFLIEKAIEKNNFTFALQLMEKYALEEKYAEKLIEQAIANNSKKQAIRLAKKYKVENQFPQLFKTKTFLSSEMGTAIVTCQITNLIKSHVFVKIEGDDRKASIYIGELANKRLPNIFEFEYEGVKLHIGQTLRARVVGIDEQNRIQLSLKNMP